LIFEQTNRKFYDAVWADWCHLRIAEPSVTHSAVVLIKVASNATIVLMSRALEEVAREAIALSQEERLVLARILLEGCDLPGYPINEAEQTWEEEIANRIRAIDSGTANLRIFPYYLPYIIRGENIWLLAVAQAQRKPRYWIKRKTTIR